MAKLKVGDKINFWLPASYKTYHAQAESLSGKILSLRKNNKVYVEDFIGKRHLVDRFYVHKEE